MGLYNFGLTALVQRFSRIGLGSSVSARATCIGSLASAQVESRRVEATRAGLRFQVSAGVVANAIAPVTDVPTTASMYVLQNNYSAASGICLVVEQVGLWLASGTAAVGSALLAGVPASPHGSALSASTGVVGPKSCSASPKSSTAIWATGATLAAAPAWHKIGNCDHAASTTPGIGCVVDVDGMFIVPPGGYYFAIHVLSGAGTSAKYSASCIYTEMNLDLE